MEILTLIINLLPELIPVLVAIVTFLSTLKSEIGKINVCMTENTTAQKELTSTLVDL